MAKILTFKDGYSIEVCDSSTPYDVIVIFENAVSAVEAWSHFTRENMSYLTLDGQEYTDIVPLDLDLIRDSNNIVIARFESRNKTEIEKIKDEIDRCLYCR